jgi:hypothetical protein
MDTLLPSMNETTSQGQAKQYAAGPEKSTNNFLSGVRK